MKINRISVQGLFGAKNVDLDTSQPINIVAGPNGAGKSSIRDAVRLALTGSLGRVALKKDAAAIVTEGSKTGSVALDTADGAFSVTITANGKVTDSHKGRDNDPRVEFSLDAQSLARLPESERKAKLFGLLGVKADIDTINKRLTERGIAPDLVREIGAHLRGGFEAAAAVAKDRAAQARGAWKAVTGDVYGAVKAAGWSAAVPTAPDADAIAAARAALAETETAVQTAQANMGAARAAAAQFDQQAQRLSRARTNADTLPRAQAKLDHDTAELARCTEVLARAAEAAGQERRVGLVHDLALSVRDLVSELTDAGYDANSEMAQRAFAALNAYTATHGAFPEGGESDEDARQRLPELRSAVELMQRSVRNSTAAVQAARDEQAVAAELAPIVALGHDIGAVEAATAALSAAQALHRDAAARLAQLEAAAATASAAAGKTEQARRHHADVSGYVALEEALGPEGVPGQILGEALQPLNDRLRQTAADTGWPVVAISRDMRITFGGRPYPLLSESEQWRVDAALAEAVGHLTGVRLLVLDRMDVLDLPGRSSLVQWLNVLATAGEIDTALVFATLKSAPAGLPSHFGAHWIANGVSLPAMAEAA
jgi:hypothetical protein